MRDLDIQFFRNYEHYHESFRGFEAPFWVTWKFDHMWVGKDKVPKSGNKEKSCNLYQTPITHKNQIYTKFKSQANVIFPKGEKREWVIGKECSNWSSYKSTSHIYFEGLMFSFRM